MPRTSPAWLHGRLFSLLPTALAVAAVLGTFLTLAITGRQAAITDARERAANIATMLAEHAGRLMDASGLALGEVARIADGRDWDEVAASVDDHLRLKQLADRLAYIQAFWLTDEAGMPRLTSRAFPAPRIPTSDREHFIRAKAGAPGPFLSRLLRSRVTGRTNVVMAQRLAGADGAFRGIAQAVIDPGYFLGLYEQVGRENGAEMLLVRDDGAVVLRHPRLPDETAMTLDFPGFGVVADYRSPADGQERIGAVSGVSGYGLLVVAGVERATALAAWRRTALAQGAYAAAAAVGILLLGLAAFRRGELERRHAAELEQRVAQRTQELERAVRGRDLLLRELNHRVKNNLQLVNGLLRVQAAGSAEPGVKELVDQTTSRIKALADVHATLYQRDRFDRLDFADYLEELCGQLASSFGDRAGGRVGLSVQAQHRSLDIDRAIPLGLIVNELVTNAYKHGFRDGGAGDILVRFGPAPIGSGWRLEVSETVGAAGPAAEAPPAMAEGIGMQLVHGFAQQLGGSVRVERRPRSRVTAVDLPWPAEDAGAPDELPRAVA